jgi:integrase
MEKIIKANGTIKYRESIYSNGKKIHSPLFNRISDCKTWKARKLNERMSQQALGEHFYYTQNTNFTEFANKWLENHVKLNCVPKTFQAYSSVIKTHLIPRFGKLNLRDINEHHGIQFMNELKKSHNPKGILNIWGVLKGILLKAKRDKLILVDPLENIKRPRQNLREDNFWMKDEINQFLRANIKDQLYPMYFVAIHTGMRLSELTGLKFDRVDFRLNQISVTRTRDKLGLKDTTKTKLKRIVPMTLEVRAILLKLFKEQHENNYVFVESDGSPVKYAHIYRRFHQAQDRALIPNKIRFHDMRHSFASNYMMNGGNVFDLQKILGHTKIDMTMRYAHLSPNHLQNSLKFMDMSVESKSDRPNIDHDFNDDEENLIMLGS